MALWCSRLARQPVTLEVDGSSPFGVAKFEQSFGSAQYASVAQLVEQRTENPRVVGSIPTGGTTVLFRTVSAGVAHPVERHLAKVEVASSSLVTRSSKKAPSYWLGAFLQLYSPCGEFYYFVVIFASQVLLALPVLVANIISLLLKAEIPLRSNITPAMPEYHRSSW